MTKKYSFPPISVFCGASSHATKLEVNKTHVPSIQNFGKILAKNGIPLIWGAGETGMMGAVSRSVLDHGGVAVGVSTHHLLYGREGVQPDVSMLFVADDMQARKLAFSKLSCAFTIFPGGAGTCDELYEYLLEREYGEHNKPLVVVNLDGFFEPHLKDLRRSVESGMIPAALVSTLLVVKDETEILEALEHYFDKNPPIVPSPASLEIDELKKHFGDEVVLSAGGPEGAYRITLKDAMIPLEMIGPNKLAESVALWSAGAEKALENNALKTEVEKLVHELGKRRYRLIHSGQNRGLKGMISDMISKNRYRGIGVASKFLAEHDALAKGLKYILVRRNEQSVDFTIKALSGLFILTPGGVDVREKLFEFLTEVDIQEHDKPILLWNYEGHFDDLINSLHYLYERGYMNARALEKVQVVKSVGEIMSRVQDYLPQAE